MGKYYLILLLMTFLGSMASYFLKKSSNSINILTLLKSKYLYIGGITYVFGAILNIYLLKYLNYFIVLPLNSLTYVWTLLISYKMLNEKITIRKILGIVFIIFGLILITI